MFLKHLLSPLTEKLGGVIEKGKLETFTWSVILLWGLGPRCSLLHTNLGLLSRLVPDYIKSHWVKGAGKEKTRYSMGWRILWHLRLHFYYNLKSNVEISREEFLLFYLPFSVSPGWNPVRVLAHSGKQDLWWPHSCGQQPPMGWEQWREAGHGLWEGKLITGTKLPYTL